MNDEAKVADESGYQLLMGNPVTLVLPRNFVGQVVDGLAVLTEQWAYTADYLEHGAFRDDMLTRECGDFEEARWIAGFYELIRTRIVEQLSDRRSDSSP